MLLLFFKDFNFPSYRTFCNTIEHFSYCAFHDSGRRGGEDGKDWGREDVIGGEGMESRNGYRRARGGEDFTLQEQPRQT